MRNGTLVTLLMAASVSMTGQILPAVAQTAPGASGTYGDGPPSNRASNITPSDTASPIAPKLPDPAVRASASPREYIEAARSALLASRTGEAQQALEMAQTRLLDRSVPAQSANSPSPDVTVQSIRASLVAIAEGRREQAVTMLTEILSQL